MVKQKTEAPENPKKSTAGMLKTAKSRQSKFIHLSNMKQILFATVLFASFLFDANAQIVRYEKFIGDLPNYQQVSGVYRRTVNPDLYVWVDVPAQPGNYAESTCKECLREAIIATGVSTMISAVSSSGTASMATASATFQTVLTSCIRQKLRIACRYGAYVSNEYGSWHYVTTPGSDVVNAPKKVAKEAERAVERVEKILGW
ncbi:MAG: hypothetical protein EPGJADBJ_04534 [Saprospiraceae bacterium]|nr:hypothetical protein [Saprospiraceae bacterium]